MIKNIVFDLGGVLIDYKPEVYLTKLGLTEDKVKLFNEIIFFSEEWDLCNAGEMSINEVKRRIIVKYPYYRYLIDTIFDNICYDDILFEKRDSGEYLKELADKGYNIYILSDLSLEHYQYNQKFQLFKYINGGVYSFEIKSLKPNRKNYEVLLDKYNLVPEETVFIDDRLKNIKTADEIGIIGIKFDSLEQLKRNMDSLLTRRKIK